MEIAVGAKERPFQEGNWFAFWTPPGSSEVCQPWSKTVLAVDQPGATSVLRIDANQDGKTDWVASRGNGVRLFWFENPHIKWQRIPYFTLSECFLKYPLHHLFLWTQYGV